MLLRASAASSISEARRPSPGILVTGTFACGSVIVARGRSVFGRWAGLRRYHEPGCPPP
jgi:hypothetical protein